MVDFREYLRMTFIAILAGFSLGLVFGFILGKVIYETDIDVFQSEPRCPKCPYCDCMETEF
jgi:hypothetical protein